MTDLTDGESLFTLQGDSQLKLHSGEDLPNHSSAGQQQGEARTLSGRTAKRRGHPPGVHHPVSHSRHRFEGGRGVEGSPQVFFVWSSYWVSADVEQNSVALLRHPLSVSLEGNPSAAKEHNYSRHLAGVKVRKKCRESSSPTKSKSTSWCPAEGKL